MPFLWRFSVSVPLSLPCPLRSLCSCVTHGGPLLSFLLLPSSASAFPLPTSVAWMRVPHTRDGRREVLYVGVSLPPFFLSLPLLCVSALLPSSFAFSLMAVWLALIRCGGGQACLSHPPPSTPSSALPFTPHLSQPSPRAPRLLSFFFRVLRVGTCAFFSFPALSRSCHVSLLHVCGRVRVRACVTMSNMRTSGVR